jgi:hypothetical protein
LASEAAGRAGGSEDVGDETNVVEPLSASTLVLLLGLSLGPRDSDLAVRPEPLGDADLSINVSAVVSEDEVFCLLVRKLARNPDAFLSFATSFDASSFFSNIRQPAGSTASSCSTKVSSVLALTEASH